MDDSGLIILFVFLGIAKVLFWVAVCTRCARRANGTNQSRIIVVTTTSPNPRRGPNHDRAGIITHEQPMGVSEPPRPPPYSQKPTAPYPRGVHVASAYPVSRNGSTAYPGNGATAYPGNGAPAYPGNGAPAYPGNGATAYPGNGVPANPGNGVPANPGANMESGAPAYPSKAGY